MTTDTLQTIASDVGAGRHDDAQAPAWWLEVAELRERIERRRAREGAGANRGSSRRRVAIDGRGADRGLPALPSARSVPGAREGEPMQLSAYSRARSSRRRRSGSDWLLAKPDRLAAWAVALGFLLVIAGLLSAH
jgi:hypothetical protein